MTVKPSPSTATLISGEFGTGKTFLLRQLALRLAQEGQACPLLLEMRSLEKTNNLDALVAQQIARENVEYKSDKFRYMLAVGRVILLFDGIKDLLGLSENPRMLSFIVELPEADLLKVRQEQGEITAAKLYELLRNRWLKGEQDRVSLGHKDELQLSDRWQAVAALAMNLWATTELRIDGVDTGCLSPTGRRRRNDECLTPGTAPPKEGCNYLWGEKSGRGNIAGAGFFRAGFIKCRFQ